MTDPSNRLPQWLAIDLGKAHAVSEIHLTFDNGLDKPYPHLYNGDYKPWPAYGKPPRCPKDFDVIAVTGGTEKVSAQVRGNYQRKVVVKLDGTGANKIKISFLASNGGKEIGIYEVRVY
jgi:hypothetical protein